MKNSKITINDIAESLGVSTISVSRALSGQTGVSEELRRKILEKSKELGYAKIKNNEDINILVLHQKPYYQDNTNFSYMVQGVERNLQKTGTEYSIEFVDKENQKSLYLPYKIAKGHRFDGVIFIGKFEKPYVEFINEKVKSFVFYTGYSPSYDYDSVWFNFNNGGYKQCEYLIKKGHKLIGFVGNKHSFKNREKLLGITTAMEDYGISIKEELFFDVDDNLEEKVEELIKCSEKPTAIICQWDFTAMKLIKLLYEKGYKVPEDISVIGSGNSEMSALSIPGLTTLDLNIEYSCEAAVNLLIKRINNPLKPNENITINSNLIERDSVKSL
ncbi:LacI family DNA-binding transcriptional regulator [Clostridium sp. 19966]|uniref:LacI family DNA-binding transcriptional regulator n=1 Tax=Clostridium sp. 19966 TaxID=2768166 RepID=UPI0028DF9571|nr:LacI family DNA-binding transcriptional regulator [Clostridium sp. 19966]MDT8717907.1 LacI family DNA-binding transcriptional regulator [Clostridium sp. 19966]